MIIRINGGRKGIKEYLETGRKQGRRESRAELDERVILAGDLQLADQIISSTRTRGDKYLHITLSFKEDQIDRTVLAEIVTDFDRFAFAAFDRDEYHYYAEAHLPRMKSVENHVDQSAETRSRVERKPHIHIVIPKRNLLSDGYLNPFGVVEKNCRFIDAFQESVNTRYGLASPKYNVRLATTGRSDVLSRSKGDHFLSGRKKTCAMLANRIMSENVTDWQHLGNILAEYGDVTMHGGNGRPDYFRLVPYGETKAIRLREMVFSREFVELPMPEKQRRLGRSHTVAVAMTSVVSLTADSLGPQLDEWQSKRSREVKYLNSGNRTRYQAYLAADELAQRQMLDHMAAAFYQKHTGRRDCTRLNPVIKESPMEEVVLNSVEISIGDNPISQRLVDHEREQSILLGNQEPTIQHIKQYLPAQSLLNGVVHSHGIDLTKYQIEARPGDGDRIICGNHRYSLNDFLTRELHLTWPEAKAILNKEWDSYQTKIEVSMGNHIGPAIVAHRVSDISRVERRIQGLQKRFERDREAIITGSDSAVARMHRLAIIDMHHMVAEQHLHDVIWREKRGDHDHRVKPGTAQVEVVESGGNMLEWLNGTVPYRISKKSRLALQLAARLGASGNPDGFMDWCDGDRCVMQDCGDRVRFIDTSDTTIEIGLRLAVKKFGPDLQINGSDSFKREVARIAAEAGLAVSLSPLEVQADLERMRKLIQSDIPVQTICHTTESKQVSSEQSRSRSDDGGWDR